MITTERVEQYKKQALRSIGRRAKNPADAGVAAVPLSPHDLLDLVHAFEELQLCLNQRAQAEEP